jgi:hypothetical protein
MWKILLKTRIISSILAKIWLPIIIFNINFPIGEKKEERKSKNDIKK